MKRRQFITLLGGAAVAWPLAARAQHANRIYRLAFVTANPREAPQNMAFLDELRRYGFVEGQNLIVDQRGFSTDYNKFPEVAAAIVKSPVDAIVCSGEIALRAAQQATRTVPILGVADDMLAAGLVGSIARPGGNTTGISIFATELDGKRQELLKDAARGANVELSIRMGDSAQKIVAAIDEAKASGAEAINFLSSPLFSSNRRVIIERVVALGLPSIHHLPEIVEDGGLASYGARITLMYRQMARLLVKVFRGATPSDLPVEQPAIFELVFNLKTAAAIGLVVPPTLLLRADKVIE